MDSWGENRDLVYILTAAWFVLAFWWAWNEHEWTEYRKQRKDWLRRTLEARRKRNACSTQSSSARR